jgi:hypothetical protein
LAEFILLHYNRDKGGIQGQKFYRFPTTLAAIVVVKIYSALEKLVEL